MGECECHEIGPVMKMGPVMESVGGKDFNINCLYVVEMRGEEDTEEVMAREVRNVWDGLETKSVCMRCSQYRELQCADQS